LALSQAFKMSSSATLKRQLKIKTGALNRLSKEHKSYVQEATDQKAKLDKFIEGNAEEWDIKNVRNMLVESQKMTANAQTMVSKTYNELTDVVEAADADQSITENDPDIVAANKALENVTVPDSE